MKEFFLTFLVFLVLITTFTFLYKKEPQVVEVPVPVSVESTLLKEENNISKNS